MARSSAARARSSCFLSTAISALRVHSAFFSSLSWCFFSSTCWSAMAMATCVFTCSSWFCMSRITCLIIFSGSSALSIRSLRFALTNVDTRSKSAMIFLLSWKPRPWRAGFRSLSCRSPVLARGRNGFVPNLPYLREKLGHLHSRKRFKQRRDLRRHRGHVSRDLVHAGCVSIAGRNDGDLVHVGQRRGQRPYHFGQARDELIDNRGLVVFLVSLGLHVHGLGFGLAFLEDDFGFRLALRADGGGLAVGFHGQLRFLGFGQCLDAFALHLRRLQHGGDQFALAPLDFGVLHGDFVLFLYLLDLHLLRDHLLLHDVGLDLISLVGGGLLLLHDLVIVGLLDLQIARGFRLLGLRQRFGQHPLLIGLRLGHGGRARRFRALDGCVTLGFGGSHIGVALDARHVRAAHVADVVVLVADFLNGERDHFQAHLVHVVRAGGAHAVSHHFRLLDDLFHRQLPDDAAQVAFHHQPDQPFAFLVGLGQELLGE